MKTNEAEVVSKRGNLFLANDNQKDNIKAVAEAVPSAGNEYARRILDFYYGVNVPLHSFGDKRVGTSKDVSSANLSVEETFEKGVVVYPNPVSSGVVNFSGLGESRCQAELLTAYGRVVNAKPINGDSGSIDVSELSSGLYYLRLNFTDQPAIVKKCSLNDAVGQAFGNILPSILCFKQRYGATRNL